MKKITVWARWDEEAHNHIENGHSENDAPTAKFPGQKKIWSKVFAWKKQHCFLNANNAVVGCGEWIN